MPRPRRVLLVDPDADCGRTLAAVLRHQGDQVRVVSTRSQALLAARDEEYDLAVVDVFTKGGGVELARALSSHVPVLVLSLGAQLGKDRLLEAALGFPVCRKASLPIQLRGRGAASSETASAARRRG